MVGDLLDLERGVILVQDGLVLLLGGQDDPVGGLNAHRGGARRDSGQSILDLNQLAGRAEKNTESISLPRWKMTGNGSFAMQDDQK